MMTVLQRLNQLQEKRYKSEHFRLSLADQEAYDVLVGQRRARVREMIEAGQVVDGGSTQINQIQKRQRTAQVIEYRESKLDSM